LLDICVAAPASGAGTLVARLRAHSKPTRIPYLKYQAASSRLKMQAERTVCIDIVDETTPPSRVLIATIL
jgi:hypothetical protein